MKNNGWINALLTLVVVALPALVLYYFTLPGWNGGHYIVPYGVMWGIAIGFLVFVVITMLLFMWMRIVSLDIYNFAFPFSLVMMAVYITPMLPIWARAIIVIAMIFTSFPTMMLTTKIKEKLIANKKTKTA